MRHRILTLLLTLAIATTAAAQTSPQPLEQFLGYKIGDRFTPYARIVDYFEYLATTSRLVKTVRFGETYEHRPLMFAVITSEKNQQNLDAIRRNLDELTNVAQTSPERAKEIARSTPVVVWLAFGVHGDESSSSEAAMKVAERLTSGADDVKTILDNCVVIIDPLQNPDGRERYIEWFRHSVGREANPEPAAYEHSQPWPGGRFNHYLIDMNRDWAWGSQQETQARIAAFRMWHPQVFVDFHEMGVEESYFFPPDATPINAYVDPEAIKWLKTFGLSNAAAFSHRGWPFFVGETFDLFYPAYGDTWPTLHGAVGMTYEMAGGGRAGRAVRKEDGTLLTLADRAERHYTTAWATTTTASQHGEELLQYTYNALRSQYDRAKSTYFLLPSSPNFTPAMETLNRNGIEAGLLTKPVSVKVTSVENGATSSRNFPAGTAVISTRQPYGAIAESLLERTPALTKEFVEQQREKVEADESDEFYDITAWSIPLAFNVEGFVTTSPVSVETVRWTPEPAAAAFKAGKLGYLIDGDDDAIYETVGQLLARGVKFSVSTIELSDGVREFSRGTLFVSKSNNGTELDQVIEAISKATGMTAYPVDSIWTGEGVALGSNQLHFVRDPHIAIVAGEGIDSTSFGALWHTFNIETGVPHTVVSLSRLGALDLSKFRVLILPDGHYDMNKKVVEKLQGWVRGGGTLIAIKGASSFLSDKDVAISKVKSWEQPKKEGATDTETRYNEFRIPGAAFRTSMNERSYLTFGVDRSPAVLIEGKTILLPVSHTVDNIVTIAKNDPLAAGFAWPESLERIKGAAYLVSEPYGDGTVITFADDPFFRLFWRGTLPLIMNAAIYSPSFPRED